MHTPVQVEIGGIFLAELLPVMSVMSVMLLGIVQSNLGFNCRVPPSGVPAV